MHRCQICQFDQGSLAMPGEFLEGFQVSLIGMVCEDNVATSHRSVRLEPENKGRIPHYLTCGPRRISVNPGKLPHLRDPELLSSRARPERQDRDYKQTLHFLDSDGSSQLEDS